MGGRLVFVHLYMAFLDTIKQIEHLQQMISASGTMSEAVQKKIIYKFRLEWNYTSNNLEGNSLTRMETRSVMIGNVTVEGKPIRDIMEMKGHDEVITKILKLGQGEQSISEKFIKEIHTGIMYEDDPEKRALIGKWKNKPNYLLNYRGERIDFATPEEVPEKMHALVNWVNAEADKIRRNAKHALHPIQLAFRFHLDYVTIHPFYDGNGRTARIFTNLILISFGYPPLYIKPEEKEAYSGYLADVQVYGGEPDLFYEFMGQALLRSEQIVLDAIEGKEIEEPEDVFKEIEMWKVMLGKEEILPRTDERIREIYNLSLADFLNEYRDKMKSSFEGLFLDWSVTELVNRMPRSISSILGYQEFNKVVSEAINDIFELEMDVSMNGFRKAHLNSFNQLAQLKIYFDPYQYSITSLTVKKLSKTYNELLTEEEKKSIIREDVKHIFENIKKSYIPNGH